MPRKRKPFLPAFIKTLPLKDAEEIKIQMLYNILSLKRVSKGGAENHLIDTYLKPRGCKKDDFGNYHLEILKPDGTHSTVMWSCHTDTVHRTDGTQKLYVTTSGSIGLAEKQAKECLGADDGAGIWLMLEMIDHNVPGYYIFHREEETGRVGSRWIAKHQPAFLDRLKMSIAFDRRGTDNVITFQSGYRCCSEDFAVALAKQFNESNLKLSYKADSTGSFTDTASYTDTIPECTNLSVGYYGAHGGSENQDLVHLIKMREVLLYHFDEASLPIVRDPSKKESKYGSSYTYYGDDDHSYGGHHYGGRGYSSMGYLLDDPDDKRMFTAIQNYPFRILDLIKSMGYDGDTLMHDLFPFRNTNTTGNVVHIGKKTGTIENEVQKEMEDEATRALAALREAGEDLEGFTTDPENPEADPKRIHEEPVKDTVEEH